MKKAIQLNDGSLTYIEMTEEEIKAMTISAIWHDEDKPIQVVISDEIKQKLLLLNQEHEILGNHPDVAMLLEYVKTISAASVNEGENLYIYLNEIYPEHKAFLESFGIQIQEK